MFSIIKSVVIKKSPRRKRTVSAKLVDGVMEALAPANISKADLDKVIENLKRRIENKKKKAEINRDSQLPRRAEELNKKYFKGQLRFNRIEYSVIQRKRFGTCELRNGTIYINECLRKMPQWVEDYVIIHELTHLVCPGHDRRFWQLVRRYPKAERAIGYLMAKGIKETT